MINNHELVEANKSWTQNCGKEIEPKHIVLHYTAGRSDESTIAGFMNPETQRSAHLVIGRDGKITQMVKFNITAWHASAFNSQSIGIEIENYGKLEYKNGEHFSWFGAKVPIEQVIIKRHPKEKNPAPWQTFTEDQINAVKYVCEQLIKAYDIKSIVGHEDVSKTKVDPGPAFPKELIQGLLRRKSAV